VAPGFIDTDMTRALPEAQREALVGQIALGRLGDAQDIADAVIFLAARLENAGVKTTLPPRLTGLKGLLAYKNSKNCCAR